MPPISKRSVRMMLSQLRSGKWGFYPPTKAPQRPRRSKAPGRVYKTDQRFEAALLRDDARVWRYHEYDLRNYVPRLPGVMTHREARWGYCHRATNCHGRILFNHAFQRTLAEHLPAEGPVFFATVASRAYVLPLDVADTVNLEGLKAFCRQAIGNATGLGIVEAALYLDCDANGPRRGCRVVSWHAHFILWNTSAAALRAARERLGSRHLSMSGQSPVWFRELGRDEIAIMARYMSKPPRKEYRRWRAKGESVDPITGEVFLNQQQSKRDIRTGNLVRMANMMQDIFTDQLLFGSGAGTPIARALAREIVGRRDREEAALDEAHARARMTMAERQELVPRVHRWRGPPCT